MLSLGNYFCCSNPSFTPVIHGTNIKEVKLSFPLLEHIFILLDAELLILSQTLALQNILPSFRSMLVSMRYVSPDLLHYIWFFRT